MKKLDKIFFGKVLFLVLFLFTLTIPGSRSSADSLSNTLIFESLDIEYKPIYGFCYEIYNNKTGEKVAYVDLRDVNKRSLKLADGEYRISEVRRPDGYGKMPDKFVTLPYKIKDGQITKTIIFYPKHNFTPGPPEPPPPDKPNKPNKPNNPKTDTPKTGDLSLMGSLVLMAISIGGGLYLLGKKKKGDK